VWAHAQPRFLIVLNISFCIYHTSMLDFGGNGAAYDPPVRVFESASILVYLCDHYDPQNLLMPADARLKAECMNWVASKFLAFIDHAQRMECAFLFSLTFFY
jgi:hypothetical protein